MNIIVIIQARMGSKRFPGKSLFELSGKPVLGHVVDAVSQVVERSSIYIATSNKVESGAIVEYCEEHSLNVHIGDEEKVASRFNEILQDNTADYFIRISGDSPLLDCGVIQAAVAKVQDDQQDFDLVTTVVDGSFPSGTNVEIIKASTYVNTYPLFSTPDHFEHVTPYFYEHKSQFDICYLESEIKNAESYKFSFDTVEDLKIIEGVFAAMERDHFTYTLEDKCEIYDRITSNTKQ